MFVCAGYTKSLNIKTRKTLHSSDQAIQVLSWIRKGLVHCHGYKIHQNNVRDADMDLTQHRAPGEVEDLHIKSANTERLKYLNFFPFTLKNVENAENKYISHPQCKQTYVKNLVLTWSKTTEHSTFKILELQVSNYGQ